MPVKHLTAGPARRPNGNSHLSACFRVHDTFSECSAIPDPAKNGTGRARPLPASFAQNWHERYTRLGKPQAKHRPTPALLNSSQIFPRVNCQLCYFALSCAMPTRCGSQLFQAVKRRLDGVASLWFTPAQPNCSSQVQQRHLASASLF